MRHVSFLKIFVVFLLVGTMFQHATNALAQVDTGLSQVGQTVQLSATDPRVIATRIVNATLGLVGIILVSILVYSGFLYMTAGGDPKKVDRAVGMIRAAIIGVVIILSSWAIARYVIDKLLSATGGGGGGGVANQGGGGAGVGGFGGGKGSSVFQIKSMNPQGSVSLRNVQVKVLFTRPIDEKTASSILVMKSGGVGLGGTLHVDGSVVTFTPTDPCPAPHQDLRCFGADEDYTIQVGAAVRSIQGQTIVCGGFAPACTGNFHTGNIVDTQAPTVSINIPLDGAAVPSDSLVSLQAHAIDDSGISYIDFLDGGTLIDQSAPAASSSPQSFDGSIQWDTAGLPLQSVRTLTARAYDVDTHTTQSTPVHVVVRSPSCFDGMKNGDETDIDCGGTPNTPAYCGACSGAVCAAGDQCSSGTCQGGACVVQPTITAISPVDGQPGTFVTIQGSNFGNIGTVTFLGGPGSSDDVIAQAPVSCNPAGGNGNWSSAQVVVAVPVGAASGPLLLKNTQSALSDATNDAHGSQISDFIVNNTSHPGLCSLSPQGGFVNTQFKATGQGFGNVPSTIVFGPNTIASFAGWTDSIVTANVPVLGTGVYPVQVKVGGSLSNVIEYQIQNKAAAGPPIIFSVDPASGPISEYVTLTGQSFGANIGTVSFVSKITGDRATADVSFPGVCSDSFWGQSSVIVKVPSVFLNGANIIPGDYSVSLTRQSDALTSNAVSFTVAAGNPKPGICSITPAIGPLGTPVTVTGEHFGVNQGNVTFQKAISGIISPPWTSSEVKTTVPIGAVTGPVVLSTQAGSSNPVNFQVRNCNEEAGMCGKSACCPNGACAAANGVCAAVAQKAMYAWESSTGYIPVAPRVVEECVPNVPQPPLPSPSPWSKRAGGDQACVTTQIVTRFTTKLEPTTVSKQNFILKKCTSASADPCATSEAVELNAGYPLLQAASQNQDVVLLASKNDLLPSTTYLVQVMKGVKGSGIAGTTMAEDKACGNGIGYCFRFKTRASADPCKVGSVSISPHPYELNDVGAEVSYLASPISQDDQCTVLQCDNYDWDWEHGDVVKPGDIPDGRAVFKTPLVKNANLKIACKQTGISVSETGNVPVHMNATVLPDKVKGSADLYIKFTPPKVDAFGPNCNFACINGKVWAHFTTPLDPASVIGNVEIRACENENCVAFNGPPLMVHFDQAAFQADPHLLAVDPVDANGNLELVPGTYYRVVLHGGAGQGITSDQGVPMTGLNDPAGFAWIFRAKTGDDALCKVQSIQVVPGKKIESQVGARQLFHASAFGKADECSSIGQLLIQTKNDVAWSAAWSSADTQIANFVDGGQIDTGAPLPNRCSPICLAQGAQAQFGKMAQCGNGIVETTDAAYCAKYNAKYAGGCKILPAGGRDAEQCDPNEKSAGGDSLLCDPSACLWKPVAQLPAGMCGNGAIDAGEACDFGRFCLGASPTSTTPDWTSCTTQAAKGLCETNGGTCSARQYRGCSGFCRHTGSSSAKGSVCGNGSIGDGEDCDDGNLNNQDGCSNNCLHTGSQSTVVSVCGNGILEPGETCEKPDAQPNTKFPNSCDSVTCLHIGTVTCGNDPANPKKDCCGNVTIDSGEDCDDGNNQPSDGCSPSCLLEGSSAAYSSPSFCSDGIVGVGEQCDAGLPSNALKLLKGVNNSAPVVPPTIGAKAGDGVIDDTQLGEIIGNGNPDAQGLMSTNLSVSIQGKKGSAQYGLQCGYTDDMNSCAQGLGLTDVGCCSVRPEIQTTYPLHGDLGVCRNVEISATFNTIMNVPSVVGNIQIATQANGGCPKDTIQVSDDFTPVNSGFLSWVSHTWMKLKSWMTGAAYAAPPTWCAGVVTGTLTPATPTSTTQFIFHLDHALESKTTYRVKFMGDNSQPNNPLADNNVLANKKGIKTIKGVVAPYDPASGIGQNAGPLTWSFTTGEKICSVNAIQVTDTNADHPLLFVKQDETHAFIATAISLQNGQPTKIEPVAEYNWSWNSWTTSDENVVAPVLPNAGNVSVDIRAKNKNGNAFIMAWLKVTQDTVNVPSTAGSSITGTAPVSVVLCENPWPSLAGPGPIAPFRDKEPTGDGSDSSLTGTAVEQNGGPYYNFSTTYCRDAGATGVGDDLPALSINLVPQIKTDVEQGILRQYLFTYGDDHKDLKKDGIGIRIASNPLHLSPEDWYAWRGFGGRPRSKIIDGYRALEDETTTYIAAANTKNPGEAIFSNIYLISHNPDASQVTVDIYNQMVASLAFNINLTREVSNICMVGNNPDPMTYSNIPYNKLVACSSDGDCLKIDPATHCGSFKQKLGRDTVRLADFQDIAHSIELYKQNSGAYPKLSAGTYLQGMSVSEWPSWNDQLSKDVGKALPQDPLSQFLSCGQCSGSARMCGSKDDCPVGETCSPLTVNGATYDPQTCWDSMKRQYLCPKVQAAPSRMYQYKSIDGGQRYELSSEFEIPKSIDPSAKWWSPALAKEVTRCVSAERKGFLCEVDSDCRTCANPKDFASCPDAGGTKVKPGSCKPVGGRFLYQDICTNFPVGQGGTCGDGVIGSVCVGGSAVGKGCNVNTDCPGGGLCSGTEVCEIGQTKTAACSTTDSSTLDQSKMDGLKVQVCSECKGFIDDSNLSACHVGVMCGNGKIDKICSAGPRQNLACIADAECPAAPGGPQPSCQVSSEVCDDGVLNGKYGHCNNTCTGFGAYCGDGQLSPGEVCDNGLNGPNANGAYCVGAACANSCSLDCKGKGPLCGDAIVTSPNEECDSDTQISSQAICTAGANINQPCANDADCSVVGQPIVAGSCPVNGAYAACTQTLNKCATSVKRCLPQGTVDGGVLSSDLATLEGQYPVCVTDDQCSNGLTCRSVQDALINCKSNTDQCSSSLVKGTCSAYPTVHVRACNMTGPANTLCTYPETDPQLHIKWTACTIQHFCGDGIIDKPGETCDDGSGNGDTKACTSSCKKNVCGDGKVNLNIEECDNGAQNGTVTCNADYNSSCAACSSQCKFLVASGGYCGDGEKNGGEQCDGASNKNIEDTNSFVLANQYACPSAGKPNALCPYVNAHCLQEPCQVTSEPGISCSSLGYDFAVNGQRPKLVAIDNALNVNHQGSHCDDINSMKEYEYLAYKECLGLMCKFHPDGNNSPDQIVAIGGQKYRNAAAIGSYSVAFANPLPTPSEFWQCVKDHGAAFGVGVQTKQNAGPDLVKCSLACGFTGCGKCSDENGNAQIGGQLVDAVYNQVVPYAKVSLFYKGTLVKQTSSDGDGKFIVTGLNDRQECSQYKIVIDAYNDNPCTGSDSGNANCDKNHYPAWNYSYVVDEAARGGYWPYTSPIFSPTTFKATVSLQNDGRIFLYPKPAVGEAYVSISWSVPWHSSDFGDVTANGLGTIHGGYSPHIILPDSYAFTPAKSLEVNSPNYPQNFEPYACTYPDRPAQTPAGAYTTVPGPNQPVACTRDVAFRKMLMGQSDLAKLPYAQMLCMHSAGEKVGGFGGEIAPFVGCPVEGRVACLAAKGKSSNDYDPACSKGVQFSSCVGGTEPGTACSLDSDCDGGGTCPALPCEKQWWDSCDFFTSGPLTTYVRYSAYSGASEPIHLFWNYFGKSVFSTDNDATVLVPAFLKNHGFKATVSTDQQIVELSATSTAAICGAGGAKDCKFWDIATINPTSGSLVLTNQLIAGRPTGAAVYEPDFQGRADPSQPNVNTGVYCKKDSGKAATLYGRTECKNIQDCSDYIQYGGSLSCSAPTYVEWSRANY